MPINLLGQANNGTTGAQTAVTGPFTPTANAKVFVIAWTQREQHAQVFSWNVSGGALTWNVLATSGIVEWNAVSGYAGQAIAWEADAGASPSSMTVTVDPKDDGTDTYTTAVVVFEITDPHPTAPFPQAAVANAQNIDPTSSSATGTLTLGSNPTNGNYVIAAYGKGNDVASATVAPSGYSTLVAQTDNYDSLGVFYRTDTTNPVATSGVLGDTVGSWGGIIIEVAPAAGGAFDLETAAIALTGTLSVSGDIEFVGPVVFDLETSPVGVTGAVAVLGDIEFVGPVVFDLEPSPIALSGVMSVAGDIEVVFDISTSPVALTGAVSVLGDIEFVSPVVFDLDPSPIVLTGAASVLGDIEFVTTFDLSASPIALTGAVSVLGDIEFVVPWEFETPLTITEISGALALIGDIEFVTPFDLNASPIALSGVLSTTGDIEFVTVFDLSTSPVALSGALSVAGDIEFATPVMFDLETSPVAVGGVLGVSGDVEFFTGLNLQTSPVALNGTLSVTGDIEFTTPVLFNVEQSGQIDLSGALTVAGDVEFGIAFDVEQSSAIALTGALGVAGDIESVVPVVFDLGAGAINLNGAMTVAGDIAAVVPFDVETTAVGLTGALAVTGDIGIGAPFDLQATTLALFGSLGVIGDVQTRVPATVPDVVGLTQTEAEDELEMAGFVVVVALVISTSAPAGQVLDQDPPAGTSGFVGNTVTITVSQYNAAEILGRGKHPNVRIRGIEPEKERTEPALPAQITNMPGAPKPNRGVIEALLRTIKPPPSVLPAPELPVPKIASKKAAPTPAAAPTLAPPPPAAALVPAVPAPAAVVPAVPAPAAPAPTPVPKPRLSDVLLEVSRQLATLKDEMRISDLRARNRARAEAIAAKMLSDLDDDE